MKIKKEGLIISKRILAISGGNVSLSKKKKVPIVGILWRNSILEKCFVKYSSTDPKPSEITAVISDLAEEKYFREKQIKLVLIFNSILAGLGIIDLRVLEERWKTPFIFITEKKPDKEKIRNLIRELNYSEEFISVLNKNPTDWEPLEETRLYLLSIGISKTEAKKTIRELQSVGHLPEPIRIADLFAKAIPL